MKETDFVKLGKMSGKIYLVMFSRFKTEKGEDGDRLEEGFLTTGGDGRELLRFNSFVQALSAAEECVVSDYKGDNEVFRDNGDGRRFNVSVPSKHHDNGYCWKELNSGYFFEAFVVKVADAAPVHFGEDTPSHLSPSARVLLQSGLEGKQTK